MPTDDRQTLRVDSETGLTLPARYADAENGLTVRVPTTTIQIQATFPLGDRLGLVQPYHFDIEGSDDPKNPNLAPDRVELSRHGTDESEQFTVHLPATAP